MKGIAEFWEKMTRSSTEIHSGFAIPQNHVIDSQIPDVSFKAHEVYFELRICEQFLQYKREYWNEFIPLTIILSEFIYDKDQRIFPFIVGKDLLKNLKALEGDEYVRYRNTRVVGPTPYAGDDVVLFMGLFRVKTVDWAEQALSLLESVAGAFDSSRLTQYLNISGPLLNGIEGFLGMGKQMQYRLGQRNVFVDPEIGSENIFVPGYFVMLRATEHQIQKEKFWVKDSELLFGDNPSKLKFYTDHDYILYQINCLDKRNDYTKFEFHNKWNKVQKLIWDNNQKMAKTEFIQLASLIRQSPDLIASQKNQLLTMYSTKLNTEIETYKTVTNQLGELESSRAGILKALSNEDKTLTLPLQKGQQYFLGTVHAPQEIHKPILLQEQDVQSALVSSELNDPSVKSLDADIFTESLITGIAKISW